MINDRYKIKKKLGTGRSQVYLCSDLHNPSKDLAIKILSNIASKKELKSFRDEFYLLKKINHPNIVRVYEYGTILRIEKEDALEAEINEDSKFFTLDYIEGKTLDQFEERGELNILTNITEQICSVLYYLHQSNYIYYDLKPENILIQNIDDKIKVNFIDFGLTKFTPNNEPFEVQGTPSYIAPEILQLNHVDHRADLYSLGILLYYLIYDKFPFDTGNELRIYKANIETDFEFPQKKNYEKLIKVTQNLLHKSPSERYKSTLQIFEELQLPISNQMKYDWIPVKVFCGRSKFTFDINSMIFNKKNKEVIAIRGEEGAGKSFFLEEILNYHNNSILIKSSDINSYNNLWQILLKKVFYSEFIYKKIDNYLKNEIRDMLFNDTNELTDRLKSIFLRISREKEFVLLLDDFNSFDDFAIEILKEIIPILQVNGVKIVLTENSGKQILSNFINNLEVFYLSSFTDTEFDNFFDKSYFKFFPVSDLKNVIKLYSNLLPGNIVDLIKNLILLDVLKYDYKNVYIKDAGERLELIEKTQNEIYKLKVSGLSNDEIEVVNLIALFDINLTPEIISLLSGINEETIEKIITVLIHKGIFHNFNVNINPQFTSLGLKNFIYNNIPKKEELHLLTAEKILKIIPGFNRMECARHFELAGNYRKCYLVLKEELKFAEEQSAVTYQKNILNRLVSFPLDTNDLLNIKFSQSRVLLQLSEFKNCLNLTNELLEKNINNGKRIELLIQKGKCLIRLSEHKEGITLLKSILPDIKKESIKHAINIEIADAELDLNNFSAVTDACRKVIDQKQSMDKTKAKAYSLLALVELKKNNNLAGAIYNFQYASNMYEKANLPFHVATMQMDIGNIINMKGNLVEAEKHWQVSYKINESIGNLVHEANLLLNYGVFYFKTQSFEKSVQQYQRAENIFSSLGSALGRGLALSNLGEVYLNICEYDLALNNLELARNIFIEIENKEEEAEVIFLFGQCYFYLGDEENLNAIINQYDCSFKQNNLVVKHKNNISYLKILLFFCSENYTAVIQEAEPVIQYYKSQDDTENNFYFAKSNMLLIKSLIYQKRFEDALTHLDDNNYTKICDKNLVLQAEREYLLGAISEQNNKFDLESPVEYFTKAISLIEKQCIIELTWEINYSLSKFFFERGNYKRFTEYAVITKSLLNYISSKINSKSLRVKYLKSFNRRGIIETIERFEQLI